MSNISDVLHMRHIYDASCRMVYAILNGYFRDKVINNDDEEDNSNE